jgi:hypothetical protein
MSAYSGRSRCNWETPRPFPTTPPCGVSPLLQREIVPLLPFETASLAASYIPDVQGAHTFTLTIESTTLPDPYSENNFRSWCYHTDWILQPPVRYGAYLPSIRRKWFRAQSCVKRMSIRPRSNRKARRDSNPPGLFYRRAVPWLSLGFGGCNHVAYAREELLGRRPLQAGHARKKDQLRAAFAQ